MSEKESSCKRRSTAPEHHTGRNPLRRSRRATRWRATATRSLCESFSGGSNNKGDIGKHLTREQKRRVQRREAMLEGFAAVGILLMIGFAVGRVV